MPSAAHAQPTTTIDDAEVARFSAIADEWWDETGKFAPLHKLNPTRLTYLRDQLIRHFSCDGASATPFNNIHSGSASHPSLAKKRDAMDTEETSAHLVHEASEEAPLQADLKPKWMNALTLVDIGCGGGLIAEPMARLGAAVTGIDASATNISVASLHAKNAGLAIDYRATTAEQLALEGAQFDVVFALEIIEHVDNVDLFYDSIAALVKPGGVLVLSTLNRTAKSYALGIVGAEYVLRWLPKGTHTWSKFIKPSEMAAALRQRGFHAVDITGITFSPINWSFSLNSKDLSVNYLMVATPSK